MRELKLALFGLSEEYKLDKIVEHLVVHVDTWFAWSEYKREDYVAKFNVISVEDALQGKVIKVADDPQAGTKHSEYKELSIDVAAILKERKHCKDEVVTAVIEGALALLNLPAAIQQSQPSIPSRPTSTKSPPGKLRMEKWSARSIKATSRVAVPVSSLIVSVSILLLWRRRLEFSTSTCSSFQRHQK